MQTLSQHVSHHSSQTRSSVHPFFLGFVTLPAIKDTSVLMLPPIASPSLTTLSLRRPCFLLLRRIRHAPPRSLSSWMISLISCRLPLDRHIFCSLQAFWHLSPECSRVCTLTGWLGNLLAWCCWALLYPSRSSAPPVVTPKHSVRCCRYPASSSRFPASLPDCCFPAPNWDFQYIYT